MVKSNQIIEQIESSAFKKFGEEYYSSVMNSLGKLLDADYVFIGNICDSLTCCTTSYLYNRGKKLPNFKYELADTPCEVVTNTHSCVFPSDVSGLYPKDTLLSEMGIQGYVGSTIISEKNDKKILVLLFKEPFEDEELYKHVTNAVTIKLENELTRNYYIRELESKTQVEESLLNLLHEGVALYSEELVPVSYNKTAYEILGVPENIFNTTPLNATEWTLFNEDKETVSSKEFPVILSFTNKMSYKDVVMGYPSPKGDVIWLSISTQYLELENSNDEYSVLVTYKNVTESRESEKRALYLDTITTCMTEGVVIQDQEGKIISCNESASEILGLTRNQMMGRDSLDPRWKSIYKDGTDFPGHEHPVPVTLSTGKSVENQVMGVYKPNGDLTWISITSSPIYYSKEEGKPDAAIATFRDITTELENSKDLNLLHTAVEQLTNQVMITDAKGRILYVNPAFEKYTGYSEKEVVGKLPSFLKSGLQSDSFYRELWSSLSKGKSFTGNLINRSKKGKLLIEEISITSIVDDKNKITHFVAVYNDIEAKEEAKLATADLEEKEMIIKEIHHRIKNNLQVVSSLLSLQASKIDDEKYAKIFDSSVRRVTAISLVHEQLYKSKTLKEVSIKSYITELITNISISSQTSAENVKFDLDVIDEVISADIIVPLGLIINELATNSLKYAFEGIKLPRISIQVTQFKDKFTITISDNGVGVENIDINSYKGSLGLKLVNSLAKQIRGKLSVKSGINQGIEYKIVF